MLARDSPGGVPRRAPRARRTSSASGHRPRGRASRGARRRPPARSRGGRWESLASRWTDGRGPKMPPGVLRDGRTDERARPYRGAPGSPTLMPSRSMSPSRSRPASTRSSLSGAIRAGSPSPAASAATIRPRAQRSVSSKRGAGGPGAPRRARERLHAAARRTPRRRRAVLAARRAGGADARAELHRGLVEVACGAPPGSSAAGSARRRAATRRTFVSTAATRSPNANDATAAAVYGPTPGSARRPRLSRGPAVARDDRAGRPQPQRALVVAQADPLGEDLRRRRGGERLRGRPARHPALVALEHARDLRLLRHELRDEDRVGIARAPPRQVAAVGVVPGQDGRLQGLVAHPVVTPAGSARRTSRRAGATSGRPARSRRAARC